MITFTTPFLNTARLSIDDNGDTHSIEMNGEGGFKYIINGNRIPFKDFLKILPNKQLTFAANILGGDIDNYLADRSAVNYKIIVDKLFYMVNYPWLDD